MLSFPPFRAPPLWQTVSGWSADEPITYFIFKSYFWFMMENCFTYFILFYFYIWFLIYDGTLFFLSISVTTVSVELCAFFLICTTIPKFLPCCKTLLQEWPSLEHYGPYCFYKYDTVKDDDSNDKDDDDDVAAAFATSAGLPPLPLFLHPLLCYWWWC